MKQTIEFEFKFGQTLSSIGLNINFLQNIALEYLIQKHVGRLLEKLLEGGLCIHNLTVLFRMYKYKEYVYFSGSKLLRHFSSTLASSRREVEKAIWILRKRNP